jgi:hypothetical protein
MNAANGDFSSFDWRNKSGHVTVVRHRIDAVADRIDVVFGAVGHIGLHHTRWVHAQRWCFAFAFSSRGT